MTTLAQIVAVEKGVKNRSNTDFTELYHQIQKAPLLSGIARTYQPKDDEGEQYPPESTKVQVKVAEVIFEAAKTLTRLFDVTATKDIANTTATADIIVDGQSLLHGMPVTYLLFLEKQLTDLHTFVKKLPTLDPSEDWHYDESADAWATQPVQTTKTKKIPRNHVKAAATEKHPAQVEVYYEDVVVGHWTTVKFSGAASTRQVNNYLAKIDKLIRAVKFAREEANRTAVTDRLVGDVVFEYVFG